MNRPSYVRNEMERVEDLPLDLQREIGFYLYYPYFLRLANDIYTQFTNPYSTFIQLDFTIPPLSYLENIMINKLIELYGYDFRKGLKKFLNEENSLFTFDVYYDIFNKAKFFVDDVINSFGIEQIIANETYDINKLSNYIFYDANRISFYILNTIIKILTEENVFDLYDQPFAVIIMYSIFDNGHEMFIFPSMQVNDLSNLVALQRECSSYEKIIELYPLPLSLGKILEKDTTIEENNLRSNDKILVKCTGSSNRREWLGGIPLREEISRGRVIEEELMVSQNQ